LNRLVYRLYILPEDEINPHTQLLSLWKAASGSVSGRIALEAIFAIFWVRINKLPINIIEGREIDQFELNEQE
jgi:hypothetical protein